MGAIGVDVKKADVGVAGGGHELLVGRDLEAIDLLRKERQGKGKEGD